MEREGITEVVIGSLDVVALYPSIDQEEGPKIVADEIRKSDLKYENVDMHLIGVYLGTMMNDSDLKKQPVVRGENQPYTPKN